MPKHSTGEGVRRQQGTKKNKAAKSRGQKTRQGRRGRATRSSRAIIADYASKVKNGKNTGAMFVAEVTSVSGAGRFHVENMKSKERVLAHVTPALSMRSAKHQNSTDEFAVRVGSRVIVDGNIIRAVVPEGRLSAVLEENSNSNNNDGYTITSKEKTPNNRH